MYMVDIRWIVLAVGVVGTGVIVAVKPSLISPFLVAVAVGTFLYLLLRLGRHNGNGGEDS